MKVEDGSYYDVDSSEMTFRICAIAALRQAYERAAPTVLDPLIKLEVSAAEEFQGNVLGQINQRRGIILDSSSTEDFAIEETGVPLSEMFGYSTDLHSGPQGKGEFTMQFSRYNNRQLAFCKTDHKALAPYRGKYQDQTHATGSQVYKNTESQSKQ